MPAVPAARLAMGQAAGAPPGSTGMCPRFNLPGEPQDRCDVTAEAMDAFLEIARTI